jgi:hypothetical protein
MVVAHECVEIAFILVFWPFGRGYEPHPDNWRPSFTQPVLRVLAKDFRNK